MSSDWCVALVVRNDQDDVGRLGLGLRLGKESAKCTEKQSEVSKCRLHAELITEVPILRQLVEGLSGSRS